jgi:type 1 glutamine amidotransferase
MCLVGGELGQNAFPRVRFLQRFGAIVGALLPPLLCLSCVKSSASDQSSELGPSDADLLAGSPANAALGVMPNPTAASDDPVPSAVSVPMPSDDRDQRMAPVEPGSAAPGQNEGSEASPEQGAGAAGPAQVDALPGTELDQDTGGAGGASGGAKGASGGLDNEFGSAQTNSDVDAGASPTAAEAPDAAAVLLGSGPLTLLVFSATAGYRHESIEAGVAEVADLAIRRGWSFRATEDAGEFTDESLADVDVVLFLSTTGDVLNDTQQAAFERYIRAGNGYVGVHAASDTEFDWPWYGGLVGAYFSTHPEIQSASLDIEDTPHASTAHLPSPWIRTDEWYGFRDNPRQNVSVLMTLNEASYSAGDSTMGDHPIAWYHEYDGGRAFYTALGHTAESYSEEAFLLHVAGGIEWAANQTDSVAAPGR